MRQDLDDALVCDFPILYRDRYASPKRTCMCWGFPGDGWEPLIRRLSEKLEAINLSRKDKHIIAVQVKEKFGTLRFYVDGGEYEEYEQYIEEAEKESARTCEYCGKPGKLRGTSWYYTACDNCTRPEFNADTERR